MSALTFELPPHEKMGPVNLKRWAQLMADPALAKFEGRIETNRHGQIILTPPEIPHHGGLQAEIGAVLHGLLSDGRTFISCPISTADGVKATDVAWASPESLRELGNRVCFPRAPEICVEVLSPSNTRAEMKEKMALYFDAGAKEVWLCDKNGAMEYHIGGSAAKAKASRICPEFPARIQLR
jgi:Uma2 family endonuclease